MNKTLRNTLLGGVCAVSLMAAVISTPARADLPVIDVAALGEWATSIGNEVKAYGLQAAQYAKQISQYTTQLQQYATQVEMFINWVHMPTLGGALGLLNTAGLSTFLPINPMALLGVVNGLESAAGGNLSFGGLAGILGSLSGFANQAWSTNHIYTPTDGSWDSQQLNAGAASIAGTQGAAAAAYASLQQHLAAQPDLRDHLLGATSPKDVQDATAQIDLEQAWTANQSAQLQAAQTMYAAQHDSREQRDEEAVDLSIDNWLTASGTGLH